MAPLFSIFDDERWLFGNHDALILFVAFVDNAIDDRELLVTGETFWGNAVVSTISGGI